MKAAGKRMDMDKIPAPMSGTEARQALALRMRQQDVQLHALEKAIGARPGAIDRFLAGDVLGPDKTRKLVTTLLPVRLKGDRGVIGAENELRAQLLGALTREKPAATSKVAALRNHAPTPSQEQAYAFLYEQLTNTLGEQADALLEAVGLGRDLQAPQGMVSPMQANGIWEKLRGEMEQRTGPTEAERALGTVMKAVFAMKKLRTESLGIDTSAMIR
jgi:hypothetical protein